MRVRALARIALVISLTSGAIVAAPSPAHALFHLMMVTEVLAGTSTAADVHFIEMQMYAENQRFLAGHEVAVFDATGAEIAAFTFTGPVANGANQAHVLLATEQTEAEFGVEADLAMTPVMTTGGGSVCFRSADGGIIDCASWGNYSGDDAETGTPFNSTLGLLPGQSMERVISGGGDPDALDAEDDTNDSEADFDAASPSPTNNAGGAAEPDTVEHERTVSLRLRRSLVAKGTVSAEGDYGPCFTGVGLRVQRKVSGAWRTVARTTTADDGTYKSKLRDVPGRYRAVAPAFSPEEGHRCRKGVSPLRRNR